MIIRECPHCGHENWMVDVEEEEPTCELCDGYLDAIADEEE